MCVVMGVAMIPVRTAAVRKVTQDSRGKVPLVGIGAAFSFLIKMFNVRVHEGTAAVLFNERIEQQLLW